MCVPTTDPGIGTDKHRRFPISKIGGLQICISCMYLCIKILSKFHKTTGTLVKSSQNYKFNMMYHKLQIYNNKFIT